MSGNRIPSSPHLSNALACASTHHDTEALPSDVFDDGVNKPYAMPHSLAAINNGDENDERQTKAVYFCIRVCLAVVTVTVNMSCHCIVCSCKRTSAVFLSFSVVQQHVLHV